MSFTPETLLRHWQTLRLIPRHPRKITAGDLCQHLGGEGFTVGKRTVERDLQALSRIFPLVVDERSKPFGWSWDRDAPAFDLPGLSASEALTLLMAKQYLGSVMPSTMLSQLAPYFRQAEKKLDPVSGHCSLSSWPDKVRIVPASQPLLTPSVDEDAQSVVQEALLQDRQCSITYRRRDAGHPDEYPISPLGLVQRGALIYLVCTIKAYSDIRILVLHRVQSAKLLDAPAVRPDGFDLDAYLASGAFGWQMGEAIQLRALFTAHAGKHLYETPLSDDQTIEVREEGHLFVTATVPETQQLLWWLLAFGDGVEVIGPESLRQKISEHLARAAGQYNQ